RRPRGSGARDGQQGPVAAHDQDEVADPCDPIARDAVPARQRLGRLGVVEDPAPAPPEGRLHGPREPTRRPPADRGDAALPPEPPRRGHAGPLHSAQFTRNPSRTSAFPRAPRMGDGSAPIVSRRSSLPSAWIWETTRRRVSSDLTTPPRGTS